MRDNKRGMVIRLADPRKVKGIEDEIDMNVEDLNSLVATPTIIIS